MEYGAPRPAGGEQTKELPFGLQAYPFVPALSFGKARCARALKDVACATPAGLVLDQPSIGLSIPPYRGYCAVGRALSLIQQSD